MGVAWIVTAHDIGSKILGRIRRFGTDDRLGRYIAGVDRFVPAIAVVGHWRRLLALGNSRLQIVCALMLVAATLSYFAVIQTLLLADALAIYFTYPFIITALAPFMRSEVPGIRCWERLQSALPTP